MGMKMKKYFLIFVCLICMALSGALADVVPSVKEILSILDILTPKNTEENFIEEMQQVKASLSGLDELKVRKS